MKQHIEFIKENKHFIALFIFLLIITILLCNYVLSAPSKSTSQCHWTERLCQYDLDCKDNEVCISYNTDKNVQSLCKDINIKIKKAHSEKYNGFCANIYDAVQVSNTEKEIFFYKGFGTQYPDPQYLMLTQDTEQVPNITCEPEIVYVNQTKEKVIYKTPKSNTILIIILSIIIKVLIGIIIYIIYKNRKDKPICKRDWK